MYFGTPVVMISTQNEDGSPNLAPMSSVWWVGQSCMLGLDETSKTTQNLVRTKECVINLVPSSLVDAVDRLALVTGTLNVPQHKLRKGYRCEPDKFGAAGLTVISSDEVEPPRVAECPIQLEASIDRIHPFGEADSGLLAFDARVVRAHVQEELLVPDRRNHVDADKWDPLIMKFCEYYGRGENLQPSSLARGWGMPQRLSLLP
ncbi:flavin reductase family protein [Streptomyces sp. NBC_00344]|uniref:flavin reductase family protein n=1 Tax=Streptomyces sp. NBC_00344 TaxID=2975720 RepID=UPI002E22C7F9